MDRAFELPRVAGFQPQEPPAEPADPLRRLRHDLGLSRADFGRLVGLSERSVTSWEAGAELKDASRRTIVEVGRLYAKLRESFATPERLSAWLKTPNKAFEGCQPLQVIERGEIDRLWRMVYFLESGSPG